MKHADEGIVAGPDHVRRVARKADIRDRREIIDREYEIILCSLKLRRQFRSKGRIFVIRNKLPAEFCDCMPQQPKAPDNIRIIICAPSVDQNVHRSPQHITDHDVRADQKVCDPAGDAGAALKCGAEMISDVNPDGDRQRRKNGNGREDKTQILV